MWGVKAAHAVVDSQLWSGHRLHSLRQHHDELHGAYTVCRWYINKQFLGVK